MTPRDDGEEIVGMRSPQSMAALLAIASSLHGPEGHYLPPTGAPPGPPHDHLSTAARALEWLLPRRELRVPKLPPSASELAMLREIRGAVQCLTRGDREGYRRGVGRLTHAARFELTGDVGLRPAASGWRAIAFGLVVPLVALDEHHASLKRCGNPRCGFVFLDRSDNQRRRWCSDTCGNRSKVRRFRSRRRKP